MKFLPTLRDAPSWMSLVAATIICTGVSREPNSYPMAMATESVPPAVDQAPTYMRRRPGPMVNRRGLWPARVGNRGYHGAGVGALRHAPWFPGGYYYPPVQGSWYQRPYPYHFDIYRK